MLQFYLNVFGNKIECIINWRILGSLPVPKTFVIAFNAIRGDDYERQFWALAFPISLNLLYSPGERFQLNAIKMYYFKLKRCSLIRAEGMRCESCDNCEPASLFTKFHKFETYEKRKREYYENMAMQLGISKKKNFTC